MPRLKGRPYSISSSTTCRCWFTLIGIDAAVGALVVVLRDGLLERAAELLDARAQDVGEADQEGKVQPAAAQVFDELLQVDARRPGPGGCDLYVSGVVDPEEGAAPAVDVV